VWKKGKGLRGKDAKNEKMQNNKHDKNANKDPR